MNYFGLFFTFMIPGIIMGTMAAVVMMESTQRRRKRERQVGVSVEMPKQKLYVHSMQCLSPKG